MSAGRTPPGGATRSTQAWSAGASEGWREAPLPDIRVSGWLSARWTVPGWTGAARSASRSARSAVGLARTAFLSRVGENSPGTRTTSNGAGGAPGTIPAAPLPYPPSPWLPSGAAVAAPLPVDPDSLLRRIRLKIPATNRSTAAAAPQAAGRRYQAGRWRGTCHARSASTAAARRSWNPAGSSGSSSSASRWRTLPSAPTTLPQSGQPATWDAVRSRSGSSRAPACQAARSSRSGWSGTVLLLLVGMWLDIHRFGRSRPRPGSRRRCRRARCADDPELDRPLPDRLPGLGPAELAQLLGQREPAPEHAALERPDRHLEDIGSLRIRQPDEVAEDHGSPEVLRDAGQGGLHGDGGGDGVARVGRCRVTGQPGVLRAERRGAGPHPPPRLVGGRVDGDPVEPGRECRRLAEARGTAQRGQEGVLRGVLRVLPVAEHPQADAEHAPLVPGHELAEGEPVPPHVRGQQLLVGQVAHLTTRRGRSFRSPRRGCRATPSRALTT